MVYGINDKKNTVDHIEIDQQKLKQAMMATKTLTVHYFVAEWNSNNPAEKIQGKDVSVDLKVFKKRAERAKQLLEAGEPLPEPLKDFAGKWAKVIVAQVVKEVK